ncbi:MAG: carboxypeptidase regulatory-like domain-containing protein [Bryobacterales bacterium]
MRTFLFRVVLLCVILLTAGMPTEVRAQVLKGQILGTVTDTSGAVVPAAAVTLTETRTNSVRTSQTNESGLYVFPNLDPGTYEVKVEMEGFNVAVRGDINLLPNSTVRVNHELNPGAVTETILVTGAPPALQTDRADTGSKIETKQLQELPLLFNRNYQSLLVLVPGTGRPFRPHSEFYNSQDSLSVRVNGQGRQFNNFQIEGIENKIDNGNLTALVPPIEAIQTVDISTSNFDPEFGNAGGAVVNVTLRSGTNELHGSVFAFHRNENAQARQVFASGKAPSVYNQFGFTAGGPIVRDKMFIFGDYQGSRDNLGQVVQPAIPTLPFRVGDFSAEAQKVYDPATGAANGSGRTQFMNNTIPGSRISPIANRILGFVDNPTRSGNAGQGNFEKNTTRVKNIDAFDVKYDWITTPNGRFMLRYSRQEAEVIDCGVYGPDCGIYGGPRNGGFSGSGPATTQSPMVSYSQVFSPSFVWEGRFGIVRNRNDAINADRGLNTSQEIGIPGVNISDWTSGLTEIRINGFTTPVVGFSPSLPWARSVTFFGVTNNFTKTTGNHVVRFGFEMRRERNDLLQTQDFNPRGRFEFDRGQTSTVEDTNRGIANAMASFLLDVPNRHGRDIDIQFPTRRELIWAWYAQDKWQVSPKLTIDAGLRWEMEMSSKPRFGGGYSNFNYFDNTLELSGLGGRPNDNGVRDDWLGLGPRIGIAYRVTEQTVVRAGYGISYINRNMAQQNFPVKQNNAFVSDNAFVSSGAMATGFPAFQEFPIPSNGIIDLSLPENALFARQNFGNQVLSAPRPYVQSWNIAVQRLLPGQFVLEVAYVGNHGVNNESGWNINAAGTPNSGNNGRLLFQAYGRSNDTNTRLGTHTYYNSLQVKVDRRFQGGLGLTTAYTWGKGINFSDDNGGLSVHGFGLAHNKGRMTEDRTHMFTQSYTYELPFGKGKQLLQSGAGAVILGGWQVQGIFSAMSGLPFTVTAAASTLNAPGNQQRANVVGKPERVGDIAGPGGTGLWFTTDAFAVPAQGAFGTGGRNIFDGPGLLNLDFSIFRRFPMPFREGADLTLRIESFNFTNTPHFNTPNGDRSNPNFGRVQGAADDARQFQFGLTLRF